MTKIIAISGYHLYNHDKNPIKSTGREYVYSTIMNRY